MINEVIYYVSLILLVVFFVIIIIQFLKIQKLNEMNAKLAASIPQQTPLDPLVAAGKGMETINDFLKTNFLKFINNKLIALNENSDTPINQLINSLNNDSEMAKLTAGYIVFINTMMSQNMKILFNRYYNVLDENGKTTSVFTQYISEWFILSIRQIQAQLTASNTSEDYSIANNIRVNASIFAEIEWSLYEKLNISNVTTSEEKK
jgi:hypothetical protein